MKSSSLNSGPKNKLFLILLLIASVALFSGCGKGEDIDPLKNRMLGMYGENRQIDGEYDATLSAVCNNGIFVGTDDSGVVSYKGIPYAEAPVGELRWKDPVPARDSDSVYEAYYFGCSPIQTEWPSEAGSYYPQSEDCLKLNIWTNPAGPSEGKPVMVFFHGGSYGWGATSDPIYDGHNLVEKYPDIILVTVGYRIGLLGFIDLSSVPGGEDYSTSGNLGLLDQICALKWIRKNIAAFGGDPANVTVFGESAGAGSVSLLPLIADADGLYRRVIAESGSVALTYSKEECQNLTGMLLDRRGCKSMDELTALSESEIMELNEYLNDYNNFPERDGIVLPEDLYAAYERGEAAHVDMLIGTNADEARYWIWEMGYYTDLIPGELIYTQLLPVMFENNCRRLSDQDKDRVNAFLSAQSGKKVWKLTELYNELLFRIPAMKQAELHSNNGNRVYTYYWTMPGEIDTVGACHAIELAYVFNNPQENIYTGNKYDQALADTVQEMWIDFARTGDPGTGSVSWEPYTSENRMTMMLGEDIRMECDLKREQRELTEPLLGYYFNGCYSQLDMNVPQVRRICAQLLAAVVLVAAIIAGVILIIKKARSKGV